MNRRVAILVPETSPEEIKDRATQEPRAPRFDSDLGIPVDVPRAGSPPHRLVVLGDSLSHGFQSGAVYNTDISYPAIIAHELGEGGRFRFPHYSGPGGLPLNLEVLLRDLEGHLGATVRLWDPRTLLRVRNFMDTVEDYWERGAGMLQPDIASINHCLAVYGWDLRDTLERTNRSSEAAVARPSDDWLSQIVEDANHRAALRVYPRQPDAAKDMTLLDAAAALGAQHDENIDAGIETLIVFLGSNNALQAVTKLKVAWSRDSGAPGGGFDDLEAKNAFTVWQPEHFRSELAELVRAVRRIDARHVIWCTVPHVTIAPLARGVRDKVANGSRYFQYYTRAWISDADFDPRRDQHLTDRQVRAIDCAIDAYNEAIESVVADARRGSDDRNPRDWRLCDIAGLMDRLASRRFIEDPEARPPWWQPYPLPEPLDRLNPPLTSHFLAADGSGGRARGGLFSIDGVHPTTVGYGILAQELISVMQAAGVQFRRPDGTARLGKVTVDHERLLQRDTLVRQPPQNLGPSLAVLGWIDETFGWLARALGFSFGK